MPTVEERMDSLESILGQFIVHTDIALRRLEREMLEFKNEMKVFKDEMKVFKDEMKVFKDEMKVFKDEMKVFKDEMKEFKDRQDEENKRKNKEWSNLSKKMGTIVEDLIAPALRPVLEKYFKCDIKIEGQRQFRRIAGEDFEVDAIAGCEDKIFMVEARSTPRFDDIKEIKEKGKKFFKFFPEFSGKDLVLIFGSISFPENVINHASKNGIYVLAWRQWEYMDILNFDDVKRSSQKS